ncbi:Threonine--tRNA ligase [Candidatus Micrarchaeum sp.]|jgi:threonyl-tRNA synthetase|uniref:threonine--tRNA ligase n=1 Tax=Candidatus Micrarchaeum sp. TaxID=2282148 RepID=UPI00092BE82B|nr:threonine--tRNA ligase [Candidatus Micrarchaeum sp.]OJI06696.1 MAG: threonine--tRNA ligase [Candidatus Micrarchaeum sp. ARMAN-1]OWP53392.1 MAG: threonine--tRNA ligase [Thermoplasmatales archaeon ARMAN]QRF73849.1 Threonine--tRNA ligase [Candidatus Micrarchaeum sp.]
MRILQLDVKSIDYELIAPEASEYEKSDEKSAHIDNALVLLTTIEKGDNSEVAKKAIEDALAFAKKQKLEKLVLYPFAHLGDNLEEPKKAMEIFKDMRAIIDGSGVEGVYAPFGWNKKWRIEIKGHPLAEQSKHYGMKGEEHKGEKRRKLDLSIVKKSDWVGLPEADHRSIGESMDLYSYQEVSPSMVYWHPHGLIIYRELKNFIREIEALYDYNEISTPALANVALWHVSGHIDYYRENMFIVDENGEELGLKPMNCPSTILIYKSRRWSYKELPFRTAIFDKLYRREVSGALSGLFRVQELTQDDGHIFVSKEKVGSEISTMLEFVKKVYGVFGLKYHAKLSTMPDEHLGDVALWEDAQNAIRSALEKNSLEYEVKEKEGAFYGPKIDFDIEDSQGRLWQCATIQVDYQLPMRFGITYTGEDGKEHTPVIIHRAVLGSIERFTAIMVEHYGGKLPLWLSPVQVRVISLSESSNAYAESVYKRLKESKLRAEIDISDKKLEKKIREAQLARTPYMVIVGPKEQEKNTVSIRMRSGKQENGLALEAVIDSMKKEVEQRRNE